MEKEDRSPLQKLLDELLHELRLKLKNKAPRTAGAEAMTVGLSPAHWSRIRNDRTHLTSEVAHTIADSVGRILERDPVQLAKLLIEAGAATKQSKPQKEDGMAVIVGSLAMPVNLEQHFKTLLFELFDRNVCTEISSISVDFERGQARLPLCELIGHAEHMEFGFRIRTSVTKTLLDELGIVIQDARCTVDVAPDDKDEAIRRLIVGATVDFRHPYKLPTPSSDEAVKKDESQNP